MEKSQKCKKGISALIKNEIGNIPTTGQDLASVLECIFRSTRRLTSILRVSLGNFHNPIETLWTIRRLIHQSEIIRLIFTFAGLNLSLLQTQSEWDIDLQQVRTSRISLQKLLEESHHS